MSFFEFPHTRTYDSDLGFIIRWIKEVLPQIDSLEEWARTHNDEYHELLNRFNNISDQIPGIVQEELADMIEAGTFQNLIDSVVTYVTERYIGALFDTTIIEALETVDGEYIFTVDGQLIIVSKTGRPTAFTTNEVSHFYDMQKDVQNKVQEGKKPLNITENQYLSQPPVLTFMHLSDYHGDSQELEWIYNDWKDVLLLADDYLCTGDMVSGKFDNPFLFYPTTENVMARSTLLCIGNHDAINDPTGWDWTQTATQEQLYNKFFAPTIGYWGVTHEGTNTYYYKDYPSHGIRLIVLNDMLQGADLYAQQYWLENTALDTSYSVVIAKHYIPGTAIDIPCAFTSLDSRSSISTKDTGIDDIVQQFINNGGKFICYLCGHTHQDLVVYLTDYPSQIAIVIDAAGRVVCNAWSDVMRYDDQRSRDLFNMIQFDTSNQLIKITRCGCNYDRYMRHKDTLCINYETKQIY